MQNSPLSGLDQVFAGLGAQTLQGFDENSVAIGQRIGGKTSRQYVRFFMKNEVKLVATETSENPRTGEIKVLKREPQTEEKLWVKIITPGDTNKYEGPAEDYHIREHFRVYTAFKDGRLAPEGNDLDNCEYLPSSVTTELKYHGCHTEEQLADASDHLVSIVHGAMEAREFARAKVAAEREGETDSKILVLEEALAAEREEKAAIIARLEALESADKPKKSKSKKDNKDESK